jgi:hypothetical protein
MAPPPAQVEEEVSDAGSEEQDIILRRSPQHRVKRNVAREKGKQKDAPPARKQLNTETDDNGEGKQKRAPKGGKQKQKQKVRAKVSRTENHQVRNWRQQMMEKRKVRRISPRKKTLVQRQQRM